MSDLRATPVIVFLLPAVLQSLLLLLGLLLIVDISLAIVRPAAAGPAPAAAPHSPTEPKTRAAPPRPVANETLSPRMRAALAYASRRYHVSAEALAPIFTAVQTTAHDFRLDPLLVIAVIAIESRFNPFSESVAGAQGLMQVIPRFHRDKLPEDRGTLPLFDPVVNIQVGTKALHEYIRRNGDVIVGLQQFGGYSDDPEQGYAIKVLAEKERLESGGRPDPSVGLPEIRY